MNALFRRFDSPGLRVFLLLGFFSMGSGYSCAQELKTHVLDGIVDFRVDQKWKYQAVPLRKSKKQLMSMAVFSTEEEKGLKTGVFFIASEQAYQNTQAQDPEKMATVASAAMVNRLTKKGMKVGAVFVNQSKILGDKFWLFQHDVEVPGNPAGSINGVVWKTERRLYSLHTVNEGKARSITFWQEFLKGWKEREQEEKIMAESYRARENYLTKPQRKELGSLLSGEIILDLVLGEKLRKLKLKESALKRAEYLKLKQISEGRKMRLIYHYLLTPEQRKKFDGSLKRRLKDGE